MSREFKNPANGHREEINVSANLCALFFGMFYFLAKGVWRHAAIQLFACAFLLWGLGLLGSVLAIFMWLGYALFAQDLVAAEYLRRGWREVELGDDGDRPIWWAGTHAKQDSLLEAADRRTKGGDLKHMKACPYCAEPIRVAALKCRYCASDVTPTNITPTGEASS